MQKNGITNETFQKITDDLNLAQSISDSLYCELQHFIHQSKKANSENSNDDSNTHVDMETEEEEARVFVQPIPSRTKRKIFLDQSSPSQVTPTSSPTKKNIHTNSTPQ